MEPITIILQTYKRTAYALRTIAAARELLHYDGALRWYVADDGSPTEHWRAVVDGLLDIGAIVLAGHSIRQGYGKNANDAWRAASLYGDLTFWLEDDFVLRERLDLTPHAYALMDSPDLGMVRLGYIDPLMLEPPWDWLTVMSSPACCFQLRWNAGLISL